MRPEKCTHCRDAEYVFIPSLEKVLSKNRIHITDIPSEIFKQIPLDFLCHCHCNVRLNIFPNQSDVECSECYGTTWSLTETAIREGYRSIRDLSSMEIQKLPCHFFERCDCIQEGNHTPSNEKPDAFKGILKLLQHALGRLSFT